jgi:hypothetical protein
MKNAFFFQLVVNLFFSLVVFTLGLFFLSFSTLETHFEGSFEAISRFLIDYPWSVPLFGVTLALIGVSLFSWTLGLLTKGHFESVQGNLKLWIEEDAFEKVIHNLTLRKFPLIAPQIEAEIHKNQLHIIAKFPQTEEKNKHEILKELKDILRQELHDVLGYNADFSLSLFFVEKSE